VGQVQEGGGADVEGGGQEFDQGHGAQEDADGYAARRLEGKLVFMKLIDAVLTVRARCFLCSSR